MASVVSRNYTRESKRAVKNIQKLNHNIVGSVLELLVSAAMIRLRPWNWGP
jgi:hypothetical protein